MFRLCRYLHTPRGLTQIPLPKSAKNFEAVTQVVPEAKLAPEAPDTIIPRRVKDLFPATVSPEALVNVPMERPAGEERKFSNKLWYTITPTHLGHLPIYTRLRNGNAWQTEIRRIEGNASALRTDLAQHLNIPIDRMRISGNLNRILIKGNYAVPIRRFVHEAMGQPLA